MGNYSRDSPFDGEVLGADYVERSLQTADEFTAPFQQLITEYCGRESDP